VSLDRGSGFSLDWTNGASKGDALLDPQNYVCRVFVCCTVYNVTASEMWVVQLRLC